jgi:hypothetical protein
VSNLPSAIPANYVSGGAPGPGFSQNAAPAKPGSFNLPPDLPAAALTNYNDLFGALNELRWKDVSLPYTRFTQTFRQDLAIHKFADADGAHVEGTGRAPMEFTARVPLLNGILQAPNEHWQKPLYPFTWRKLVTVCSDKSSGTLNHPELGPITCKLESFETVWDGNVRSGVWVDIRWIETDDSGVDLEEALSAPSPLAALGAFASDLDLQMASLNPDIFPTPYVPQFSLTDLANSVRAVFDQYTLLQKSYAGRVANIIYEANQIEASANAAGNASCLNWPLLLAAEGIKSAAYDVQATQLNKARKIGLYTCPMDMTMGKVANAIGVDVMTLIQLNPGYVTTPVVPQNTVVRYYQKAA